MSKKEDLSGITNEEELLRTFFLLEEKARSALESGSMSLQEFRRKSEIIIETMQKHLKIEHTLNDLANRIEAEQDEVEKHFFHPTYFIMFLDWTTLTFAINYKQHNRVIPNPFFKLDLCTSIR